MKYEKGQTLTSLTSLIYSNKQTTKNPCLENQTRALKIGQKGCRNDYDTLRLATVRASAAAPRRSPAVDGSGTTLMLYVALAD